MSHALPIDRWQDRQFADEPYVAGVSESSSLRFISRQLKTLAEHYAYPISRSRPPSLAEQFRIMAEQWERETAALSSVTEIAIHPAYQRIIGLGPDAVPLILAELRRRPNHWFWALRALTGADPAHQESRGRVHRMAEAWLSWGRAMGLTRD